MSQFPPRRIVVPFDFTELSQFALRHALRLAEKAPCDVELLYVAPPASEPMVPEPHLSEPSRQAIVAKLERAGGPGARGFVAEGEPVEAIARRAAETRADLIIMGTEGRAGLRRLARPSVAERVVRRAETPVLTVRSVPRPVHAVLAPVNLEPYALAGLRAAAEAAAAQDALLTAFCVVESDEEASRAKATLAEWLVRLPQDLREKTKPQVRVDGGRPVTQILEHAAAFGLVVLVGHRKSLVGDAVLGTTAEQVLRRCPVPVLVVPAEAPVAAAR